MKKVLIAGLFLAVSQAALAQVPAQKPTAPARSSERPFFGRFGFVSLYQRSANPSHVVLFVSGDGGWNKGVVDMAQELSALDTLVVGIDITHYLKELAASKESCVYPAADFEALSQFIQKKLGLPRYESPILVGYSSGATLVYALLAEAPAGTFRGAVSLGFCPDLALLKPLCRGDGLEWKPNPKGKGVIFLPAPKLKVPWVALQGAEDQVCNPQETQAYVKLVGNGEIIMLPKVGHGFSVPKNWMSQFKQAFSSLTAKPGPAGTAVAPEVGNLPLVELAATAPLTDTLAVFISGDGGWAGIDRQVSTELAARGVAVVGLDSLRYFWKKRGPDEAAQDLRRILQHYFPAWKKSRALLIGYSQGADVLPFMTSRLPRDLLAQVQLVALLGPSRTADFEFHLTDWLGITSSEPSLPVLPEVQKLRGMRILCFSGDEEKDSLCELLGPSLAESIVLKGGHHFGGDYKSIAETILKQARLPAAESRPK